MTSDEALKKLRQHAGYEEEGSAGGMQAILHRGAKGNGLGDVEGAAKDVVRCLEVINRSVNPDGERSDVTQVPRPLPRTVIGAVATICFDCVNAATDPRLEGERMRLLEALWDIQCAWNALAAGDIGNIREHVRNEKAARR